MRRGVPFASLNSQQCVKPFRDQSTPEEERQHDIEERLDENRDDYLEELEPDVDPEDVVRRHLEVLAELLTTPGRDA